MYKCFEKLYWYCHDYTKIENYEEAMADPDNIWDCHHRREVFENGNTLSVDALKHFGLYYNVPPEDLIFMKHSDHMKLHKGVWHNGGRKGRPHTNETRQLMSKVAMGHSVSEETREKLRKWHTGRKMSDEARKRMSEAQKARFAKMRESV